jgi:hypothetical protein
MRKYKQFLTAEADGAYSDHKVERVCEVMWLISSGGQLRAPL